MCCSHCHLGERYFCHDGGTTAAEFFLPYHCVVSPHPILAFLEMDMQQMAADRYRIPLKPLKVLASGPLRKSIPGGSVLRKEPLEDHLSLTLGQQSCLATCGYSHAATHGGSNDFYQVNDPANATDQKITLGELLGVI